MIYYIDWTLYVSNKILSQSGSVARIRSNSLQANVCKLRTMQSVTGNLQ